MINVYEAKTHLSQLLERVAHGEEIIIAKAGKPMARLVAISPTSGRLPGIWAGNVRIAEDFDDFSAQDEADWYGA